MKKILILFCYFLAFYAVWFPFSYFGKNDDKMEVKVSHILVNTKEEAENLKKEIDNGKSFEELAREKSIDNFGRRNNGSIGYNPRYKLDTNINNAVFTMPVNKVSEPIESKYGWHLVKVTDIRYYSDSENFKYNPYRYVDSLKN